MKIEIEKIEEEIKALLTLAKYNKENAKCENENVKEQCYFMFLGEERAYYEILGYLKYLKEINITD